MDVSTSPLTGEYADGQRALAYVLMRHIPHSRWVQQTCGELKAGEISCIQAVLALLLTGLQLCLPSRSVLANTRAHYNKWHKTIPSALMVGINTSRSRQTVF